MHSRLHFHWGIGRDYHYHLFCQHGVSVLVRDTFYGIIIKHQHLSIIVILFVILETGTSRLGSTSSVVIFCVGFGFLETLAVLRRCPKLVYSGVFGKVHMTSFEAKQMEFFLCHYIISSDAWKGEDWLGLV